MNELELLLRERLSHGPMTFAEYQETALYHPNLGYYARIAAQRMEGSLPDLGRIGSFLRRLVGGRFPPDLGVAWSARVLRARRGGSRRGWVCERHSRRRRWRFRRCPQLQVGRADSALAERQMSLLSTYDNVVWIVVHRRGCAGLAMEP